MGLGGRRGPKTHKVSRAGPHSGKEFQALREAPGASGWPSPEVPQAQLGAAGLEQDAELGVVRFFARIRAFDIACPRCDQVAIVGRGGRGKASSGWNPRMSIWECRKCGLVLALGVVGYRRKKLVWGRRVPPEDTVPTLRQGLKLREQVLGVMAPDPLRHKGNLPVNAVVAESCGCACGCYPGWHRGWKATKGRCLCRVRGCKCLPPEASAEADGSLPAGEPPPAGGEGPQGHQG